MSIYIKVLTKNIESDYENLRKHVIDYNVEQTGTYGNQEPLFLGCYDDANSLIAGLYGYFFWGMFYIDLLWVDDKLRNQKLGSKLLQEVENQAMKKQALYVRVNTASFQALDFYKKNGYEVFAELPITVANMPYQFNYYLIKYLS